MSTITPSGVYAGRTRAPFAWWDDAVAHALWRDQRKYRVNRAVGFGTVWVVTPAIERGGSA